MKLTDWFKETFHIYSARSERNAVMSRDFMLTCLFVLKLLKGRLRAAGPPAGESGPPGPWIHLPRNLEYFKELAVAEGGYVELEQFDSDGGRRGTALWQVDHIIEKKKEGL